MEGWTVWGRATPPSPSLPSYTSIQATLTVYCSEMLVLACNVFQGTTNVLVPPYRTDPQRTVSLTYMMSKDKKLVLELKQLLRIEHIRVVLFLLAPGFTNSLLLVPPVTSASKKQYVAGGPHERRLTKMVSRTLLSLAFNCQRRYRTIWSLLQRP